VKKNVFVIFIISKYDTSPNRPTGQKEFSGHILYLLFFSTSSLHQSPIFSPLICLLEISATKVEVALIPKNNIYKLIKVYSSLQIHDDMRQILIFILNKGGGGAR
jgi:hypothetical protein